MGLAASLLLGAGLLGVVAPQQQEPSRPVTQGPTAAPRPAPILGRIDASYLTSTSPAGSDSTETIATGGVVVRIGEVEFRAQSVVLSLDPDELQRALRSSSEETVPGGSGDGVELPPLPKRRLMAPPSKRRNGDQLIRKRMAALLRAAGGDPARLASSEPKDGAQSFPVDALQHLYMEGDVTVLRLNQETVHASRLTLSPLDDRMVLEDATLRLTSEGDAGPRTFTVRGPRFVRQGRRWTGRHASITADPAGDPELDLEVGFLELVQREDEFEMVTRDSRVRIQGLPILPLPKGRLFTKNQQPFLLQGFTGGYSDQEGASVRVELGGSLNETGGAAHSFFTGRPRTDFRGDWSLGVGWIEKRGIPLSPQTTFQANTDDGRPLYFGRIDGFFLEDDGDDFRRITRRADGSIASEGTRYRAFTETRVFLDEGTTLDLTLQKFSDEAVYTEFFEPQYLQDEEPETSLILRSARDNRLLLARGRWNLNRSSYGDSRLLDTGFVEELPRLSYDIFEQPLVEMPWGRPLTVSSHSEFAVFRTNADDLLEDPRDQTARIDQTVEVATAFSLGAVTFRPFHTARFTWYDRTATDRSGDRWAFSTGIQAGSRFQRTFEWLDDAGESQALRHVIVPQVTFEHIYKVDGEMGQFAAFDQTDSLDEQALTRFTLLNRIQRSNPETGLPEDVIWLDLVQNVLPIASRDNGGDELGLLEYELIVNPIPSWSSMPGVELLVEGEHDWNRGENRTFNSRIAIQPTDQLNLFAGYRTDQVNDGQVDFGGVARVRDRWTLFGGGQYDLENSEFLTYLARIGRRDRNWELGLTINFDDVADEVRIRLDFTPLLIGLRPSRNYGFQGGSETWGSASRF